MGVIKQYWRHGLLIIGGWTVFALFFIAQASISAAYFGRAIDFRQTLFVWFTCAYLWAPLTPVVVWLTRYYRLERSSIGRGLAFHFGAGLLLSFLQIALYVIVYHSLPGAPALAFGEAFQSMLVLALHENLLIYWTIIGLAHAADYYRRFRERERRAAQLEVEAAQLETQLTRAPLDALKMQLHPHFLFNTLNTISVLMKEDVAAADSTLLRLGDLLRQTIKNTDKHEITLGQELDFLRSYLEIEQTRFHDRLKVDIVADEDILNARVPNLVLQPLVENCIRHAVGPRAEASRVEIRAARSNGHLRLTVRDNGPGMREGTEASKGIGLANTRARLEKLYGRDHEFKLSDASGGGLEINISFPYHIADATND